jgi:acetate kinase
MKKLKVLGVVPDEEANNVRGKEALISASNSKIPVYIIPTNEELMIATDTYNLAK